MRMRMLGALVVLGLALSACTAPTKQYVAADSLGMYFALPRTWVRVPAQQLTEAEKGWTDDAGNVFQQTLRWQGAWAGGNLNANAVLAARPTKQPVLFAFVRDLIGVEQQGIGADIPAALRDLVLPASSLTPGAVREQALRVDRFRGLRQTATYAISGVRQTTTVESMLAPGKDRVYVVMVRCTQACYQQHRADIDAIIGSLTFKEPRA